MKRRTVLLIVAIFSLALLPQISSANVAGNWNVKGEITVKAKVPGHPRIIARESATDYFQFHPGGAFDMIGVSGSWAQREKKFWVYLNQDEVEDLFRDILDLRGIDASSDITKLKMTGREQRRGARIKGTILMKMRLYLHDYGVSLRITAKVKFTGLRAGPMVALSEKSAADFVQALENAVIGTVLSGALALEE